MNFVYLQTFCEIAKWGSFTRAAEELGYVQSSVTVQVHKLEEAYGVVLFERYGRKMRLTQAGEQLLTYAQQILALHEESKSALSRQHTGTLTVGTIETLSAFYLPSRLGQFRQSHPEMTLLLQLGNESAIIQSVKEGETDLGLILDLPFADHDLVCLPLRQEELIIAMPPGHRLHDLPEVNVHDLAGESLILTEEGCTYRSMLTGALKERDVPYQMSCEFGSMEAIKQCVALGLGIALMPRMAATSEVEQGKLVAVPFVQDGMEFHTQLIYHKKKWLSTAFQEFVALLRDESARNCQP